MSMYIKRYLIFGNKIHKAYGRRKPIVCHGFCVLALSLGQFLKEDDLKIYSYLIKIYDGLICNKIIIFESWQKNLY